VIDRELFLAARSNNRQDRSDCDVTNDIRADPRDFTGAYGSVEKDTVAYGSGTWVRTYDAWVLREGQGMVRMLLTGCTNVVNGGCSWLGIDRRGRQSTKGGGL
jgi:hypothetical protein